MNIEHSKIVCIGYTEGELLPPYDKPEDYLSKNIGPILLFLNEHPQVRKSKLLLYGLNEIDSLEGPVGVIGAWGDQCVPEAIAYALLKGKTCLTNPDLVAFPKNMNRKSKTNSLKSGVRKKYTSWKEAANDDSNDNFCVKTTGDCLLFDPLTERNTATHDEYLY